VDFAAGKLRVYQAFDKRMQLGPTKHTKRTGRRDRRDTDPIDLLPKAQDVLIRRMADSAARAFEEGDPPSGPRFIFRKKFGGPRQRRDVQRAFNKARDRAALPVTNDGTAVFHSLRHTCASRLANDPRVGPVYAQHHLGHTDLATTMSYIKKVESPERVAAAAEVMG
jgi:integrase